MCVDVLEAGDGDGDETCMRVGERAQTMRWVMVVVMMMVVVVVVAVLMSMAMVMVMTVVLEMIL